jgi:hypothetical protein
MLMVELCKQIVDFQLQILSIMVCRLFHCLFLALALKANRLGEFWTKYCTQCTLMSTALGAGRLTIGCSWVRSPEGTLQFFRVWRESRRDAPPSDRQTHGPSARHCRGSHACKQLVQIARHHHVI